MSLNRILYVPDPHAPYEDKKAVALVDKIAKDLCFDDLVCGGDLCDMYQISAFGKDHDRLPLDQEIQGARDLRAKMDAWPGVKRKYITFGNHEDRWTRFMQDPKQADAMERHLGYARETTPDDLFQLSENGWKTTPYRDFMTIGKVHFTHDTGQGGEYATAQAGKTFGHSVVIGHHHAMQMFVLGNALGERWGAWQFGWLGDIERATYEHKIKRMKMWTLGCGVGVHDTRTGYITWQPVPFINYTAEVGGKVYRA